MRNNLLLNLLPLLILSPAWLAAADEKAPVTRPAPAGRFVTVDVYVDSGKNPRAAWQVQLSGTRGNVTIVGIEGGSAKDVYRDPPYYDPAALAGGRIIIASYTTAEHPPMGRILVAKVHLRVEGEYQLAAIVMAAADPAEHPIAAEVQIAPTTRPASTKE